MPFILVFPELLLGIAIVYIAYQYPRNDKKGVDKGLQFFVLHYKLFLSNSTTSTPASFKKSIPEVSLYLLMYTRRFMPA